MTDAEADAWYIDLMHWINKTGPHHKDYKQQRFGVSRHWLWLMGREGGVQNDFEKTSIPYEEAAKLPPVARKTSR